MDSSLIAVSFQIQYSAYTSQAGGDTVSLGVVAALGPQSSLCSHCQSSASFLGEKCE